ncbi:hypothetical protein SAMN05443247_06606 [Bradyrhizobium erythrophlei]|nr:hypothetical protein SAMN05443247_06606 [Bradyrhizobium erythrophlei]
MVDSIWPPLITGMFTIGGVVIGLGWNALQTPKTEERLRRNTRIALRTSLWAELTSLAKVMSDEIKWIQNNDFTWVPLVESFKIYLANVANLGLLTPPEAEKITEAYYQYQESAGYVAKYAIRARRRKIAKNQPETPTIGRLIEFDFTTEAGAGTKQDVINALTEIVSKANDAVRELELQLKPQAAKLPAYAVAEIDVKDQDGYAKDFLPKAQAKQELLSDTQAPRPTVLQAAFAAGLIAFLINKIVGSPFDDTLVFAGVILAWLALGTLWIAKTRVPTSHNL